MCEPCKEINNKPVNFRIPERLYEELESIVNDLNNRNGYAKATVASVARSALKELVEKYKGN